LERWGSTLRALASQPDPVPADLSLLEPPRGFPWKAERVIWQVEGEKSARHLLGSGWETEVRELGLSYGIDLSPGTAPGLFPDQRENRRILRSMRPASLLNLFAHTCAFGVTAASEGGATLNIDSSSRALLRGKENYARNRLEGPAHRFWTEDVRKALPRLIRRGEKFDAVILDPPTFAHGSKGHAFRVAHELEPLLVSCLALTAPRGVVLLSVNDSRTEESGLAATLRDILAREQIRARIKPGQRPPEVPTERMPATLWIFRED
jgi:23S rRNA (cytosine1962-C5)-methyltransferase